MAPAFSVPTRSQSVAESVEAVFDDPSADHVHELVAIARASRAAHEQVVRTRIAIAERIADTLAGGSDSAEATDLLSKYRNLALAQKIARVRAVDAVDAAQRAIDSALTTGQTTK